MIKIEKCSTELLIQIRQWILEKDKDIGIHSANKLSKMLNDRKKDIDQELWSRIVSQDVGI